MELRKNLTCPICLENGLIQAHEKTYFESKAIEIHSNESYMHAVLDGKDVLIRFGPGEDVEELLEKMHEQ